ncbi:MAG: HesA/MoeB/ThiF family protein [Deltaproteobacteria bacterium]|nr:MAG: HesA/MoeB/ThiF family protein [Deltaproteobacteria bacterium]
MDRRLHAVVIGTGGLGCPAILGLLAAGVDRFTLVDDDVVETSNLARQVLYGPADVGFGKAGTARAAILRRVPGARVEVLGQRLAPQDATSFVADLDDQAVVLDATDDPAVKFALNDACRARGVPLVIGAALGLAAQVMGVGGEGACYRCIYEAPPPPERLPTCDRAGVLPTVVGLAGFAMAQLATAFRGGILHVFDGATTAFRTLHPERRATCPACNLRGLGPHPSSTPPSIHSERMS